MLVTLLIACLALPATAAPLIGGAAASDVVATSPCHDETPAKEQQPAQTVKHQCIGCVPLVTACAEVAAPAELRGVVGVTALVHRLTGLNDLPATPPPRG